MAVIQRPWGSGAHLLNVRMLDELHEAGLLMYEGVVGDRPRHYLVKVGGQSLLLDMREVGPFAIGVWAGQQRDRGGPRHELPVIGESILPASSAAERIAG